MIIYYLYNNYSVHNIVILHHIHSFGEDVNKLFLDEIYKVFVFAVIFNGTTFPLSEIAIPYCVPFAVYGRSHIL